MGSLTLIAEERRESQTAEGLVASVDLNDLISFDPAWLLPELNGNPEAWLSLTLL